MKARFIGNTSALDLSEVGEGVEIAWSHDEITALAAKRGKTMIRGLNVNISPLRPRPVRAIEKLTRTLLDDFAERTNAYIPEYEWAVFPGKAPHDTNKTFDYSDVTDLPTNQSLVAKIEIVHGTIPISFDNRRAIGKALIDTRSGYGAEHAMLGNMDRSQFRGLPPNHPLTRNLGKSMVLFDIDPDITTALGLTYQ